MSILDEMRNEQQETRSSSTGSSPSEPTNAEVIAAVNRQTKAVNDLKGYLRIAIEETVKEEVKALSSTSQPSASTSPQIESVESRLSEIESTLDEFAQSLDGKRLQIASQSLIAEAQKDHADTALAIEKLQTQAEENQKLVSRVGGAVQRIEKRTEERVEKAIDQVAGEASAVVAANLDTSNDRAGSVLEAAGRIEDRLGWVAAGRMALALIPVAVVALMLLALIVPVGQVLGVGPLFGWAWSVVWDGSLFWAWRVLMALATLAALAGFGWLAIRLVVPFSAWLDERVQRWGR